MSLLITSFASQDPTSKSGTTESDAHLAEGEAKLQRWDVISTKDSQETVGTAGAQGSSHWPGALFVAPGTQGSMTPYTKNDTPVMAKTHL